MRGSSTAGGSQEDFVCACQILNLTPKGQRWGKQRHSAQRCASRGRRLPSAPRRRDSQGAGLEPFIPTFDLEMKPRSFLTTAVGFAALWARGEGIPAACTEDENGVPKWSCGPEPWDGPSPEGRPLCWSCPRAASDSLPPSPLLTATFWQD